MKVILLLDIPKIGKKDQVIEVSDGYAKNYLIKNKLAVVVTKGTMDSLDNRKKIEQANDNAMRIDANALKEKIERQIFNFNLKCHANKTFGHISLKEVLIEVNKEFPQINKFMFVDKNHEWGLGKHILKVKLYKDIVASLTINVIGDNC